MSPPLPDLKDRTVGRYRVLGPLGRGGMGLVYRAEDPRLGRAVALKLLPEPLSGDPHAQARLDAEARAASQLDHPNICTVYEVGETDDGHLFLAMACYDGQTLAEALTERGVFPVEEAVSVARQVAAGLAAAHRRDIVHRDLKPSNVFLCADEDGHGPRARILDFGVAKVAGVDLTETGGTVGTVAYAAPEQARGERVDGRADLWALGVVLYEMLAGRRPFEAVYEAALLNAIQFEAPVSLRAHRPEVPEAVEAVVMRLLEKDPADRFQTAAEVEAALGEALTHPEAVPPRRRRRPQWAMPMASAAVLVLALAFVFRGAFGGSALTLPEERGIAVLPLITVGERGGSSISTDGLVEMIAGELAQLERYQDALWVASTNEVRAQEIESPRAAGRVLGVALAVTGSIEQDSTRILLRLNLEDAGTGRRLRSRVLEVPLSDLDALQRDALAALAQMLDVELQPEARQALAARGTTDAGAFAAYVRGLGLLEEDTPEALDRAITLFARSLDEDPGFALAHARMGEAYLRKYNETEDGAWVRRAEKEISLAVALNLTEPQGYVARAVLYTTTGRYTEAVGDARHALTLNPGSEEAYFALANAFDRSGETALAEATYREAIARKPGYWGGLHRLAYYYYTHSRYEEALHTLRRILNLAPDNADVYNLLGAVSFGLERFDEASQAWERAAALRPDYYILANLGSLQSEQGHYAEAARAYRRALELDDQDYRTWGNLAETYGQMPDQRGQATAAYREAIYRAEAVRDVNPNDPSLLALLASYYVAVGDTTRGRAAVREAISLAPEGGDPPFYIGLVCERLGERDEALRWIGAALAAGYSRERIEGTPELADLRRDPRYATLSSRPTGP